MKREPKPHTLRFTGKIPLGKREVTYSVECTLFVPPDLTPEEEAALGRFSLADALATTRAVPSGRVDAILASIKARESSVTTVSDYLGTDDSPARRTRPRGRGPLNASDRAAIGKAKQTPRRDR